MLNALFMIVPQEAYILLIMLAAFLILFGMRQLGAGLLLTVILLAIFGPFIDSLIDCLPDWLFALLCLGLIIILFRLIFGKGVADQVIGRLVYDLIRAPFLFMAWVLRGFRPRGRA